MLTWCLVTPKKLASMTLISFMNLRVAFLSPLLAFVACDPEKDVLFLSSYVCIAFGVCHKKWKTNHTLYTFWNSSDLECCIVYVPSVDDVINL